MFERFTQDARRTVTQAQEEARGMHCRHIGTEHLLLGLLAQDGTPAQRVLAEHGLTHEAAAAAVAGYLGPDDLDAGALSTLGIDLDAVRESVEAAFGKGALDQPARRRCRDGASSGHIPFTPRAKKVLELALRESLALEHRYIGSGHILLGLLREGDGLAMKVLHDRGIDPAELRRELTAALGA